MAHRFRQTRRIRLAARTGQARRTSGADGSLSRGRRAESHVSCCVRAPSCPQRAACRRATPPFAPRTPSLRTATMRPHAALARAPTAHPSSCLRRASPRRRSAVPRCVRAGGSVAAARATRAADLDRDLTRDEVNALVDSSTLDELCALAAETRARPEPSPGDLLPQGVRAADARVPRRVRLLHLRLRSHRHRSRLHDPRRGPRRRRARSSRGRHRVPLHTRRPPRGALPRRARRAPRHGTRLHRRLPRALRRRSAPTRRPPPALQRRRLDPRRTRQAEKSLRLPGSDARVRDGPTRRPTRRRARRVREQAARGADCEPRPSPANFACRSRAGCSSASERRAKSESTRSSPYATRTGVRRGSRRGDGPRARDHRAEFFAPSRTPECEITRNPRSRNSCGRPRRRGSSSVHTPSCRYHRISRRSPTTRAFAATTAKTATSATSAGGRDGADCSARASRIGGGYLRASPRTTSLPKRRGRTSPNWRR